MTSGVERGLLRSHSGINTQRHFRAQDQILSRDYRQKGKQMSAWDVLAVMKDQINPL